MNGTEKKQRINLYVLVDSCGAMVGSRIGMLNAAIEEWIPNWHEVKELYPVLDIRMRILSFGTDARWVSDLLPIDDFIWRDIAAGGLCDMGRAFRLMDFELLENENDKNNTIPIIILVSGNSATDNVNTYLDILLKNPMSDKTLRAAVVVGEDYDKDIINKFISSKELLFTSNNSSGKPITKVLLNCIKYSEEDFERDDNLGIIVHKFPQIWNEIKRFKAILMDYYPDNKMKRNLLVVSSEEKIPHELSSTHLCSKTMYHRLVKKMMEASGCTEERANEIVDMWIIALNCEQEIEPVVIKADKKALDDNDWTVWD